MKNVHLFAPICVVVGIGIGLLVVQRPPAAADEAPDSPLYKATLDEALEGLQASELVANRPLTAADSGGEVAAQLVTSTFPAAGTDIFETTAMVDVFFGPNCFPPQFLGQISMNGPTTVMRGAPSSGVIQTEILAMDLSGFGPPGHVVLRESPTLHSMGMVQSQNAPQNDFPADSFFDVFFEVEFGTASLHGAQPLHMQAPINAIPPFGTQYQGGPTCVDLLNASEVPQFSVANVVHVVEPPRYTTAPNNPVTFCRTEVTKCGPFTQCQPGETGFTCPRVTQWPVDVPTRCPNPAIATTCPIKQTRCPVQDTVCPADRVPTMCPSVKTKCPPVSTACPKVFTECPANVPTKHPVVATSCPKKMTNCPEIKTKCPVVGTACPGKPTTCTDVPTVCPKVPTSCPKNLTFCPGVPTKCPMVKTACPAKVTKCQAVLTKCPATPTTCAQVPTKCVNVPTICPKTATICPKMTQCPPHIPPPAGCDEVIINELMWDGTDLGPDDEYIELRNLCPNDVGITGWTIRKNNVTPPMVTLSGIIPAGGYFVVSNFDAASSRINGAPPPNQVEPALDLDDFAVQYQLYDAGGALRDRADDGVGPACKGVGAPNYYSMERNTPPGNGALCLNWHTATTCVNFDAAFCPGVPATGYCLGGLNNGLACTTNANCDGNDASCTSAGAPFACCTGAGVGSCDGTCQGAGPQGLGTPGNANVP